MAYALVGSRGAATFGTLSAAITPAYGQTPTAGNLLILWVAGGGGSTLPAAPDGTWSTALQKLGSSNSSSIFYKIAGASETNPTVAAVTSVRLSGNLAEFSGNASSAPIDSVPSTGATGTTSPQTATNQAADVQAGELVIAASATRFSTAGTNSSGAHTFNNGATATSLNNNGTSNADHYFFSYGITTGNSTADNCQYAFTTTNITGSTTVLASFLLASAAVIFPNPDIVVNRGAIVRGSVW